jgi:hypothetical protein
MGVRGGLAPVVGLGLDDDAAHAIDQQRGADQRAGHVGRVGGEIIGGQGAGHGDAGGYAVGRG